jgi:hypothetical protein
MQHCGERRSHLDGDDGRIISSSPAGAPPYPNCATGGAHHIRWNRDPGRVVGRHGVNEARGRQRDLVDVEIQVIRRLRRRLGTR